MVFKNKGSILHSLERVNWYYTAFFSVFQKNTEYFKTLKRNVHFIFYRWLQSLTMEVILSTAFGVKSETQTVENDPVTEMAKKAMAPNPIFPLLSKDIFFFLLLWNRSTENNCASSYLKYVEKYLFTSSASTLTNVSRRQINFSHIYTKNVSGIWLAESHAVFSKHRAKMKKYYSKTRK